MSPRLQFRGPARQRGAIGLMAALTLTLALAFMLLVVDIGVQTCQRLLILPPTCYNHQPGVGGSIDIMVNPAVAQNANMSTYIPRRRPPTYRRSISHRFTTPLPRPISSTA